jgi:thiamine-monophosphate kinase
MPREFKLIERIRRGTRTDHRVRLGIGDDAAVLRPPAGKDLLVTTDMLVEGRHFTSKTSAYLIGRKAMAVNLSDIAAMGGEPAHAVVSVGLPAGRTGAFATGLYRGLREMAARFGVNIVGGDTNACERVVVNVALLGEVAQGRAWTRAGAKVGDHVFVTGALGGSYRSGKHLKFTPRLEEARWLRRHARVHAMMDLSDGLASDLRRMAQESKVGFLIGEESVPVAKGARGVKAALGDGEDFELLFTVSARESLALRERFHEIGRVVPSKEGIRLWTRKGKKVPIRGGYEHFA